MPEKILRENSEKLGDSLETKTNSSGSLPARLRAFRFVSFRAKRLLSVIASQGEMMGVPIPLACFEGLNCAGGGGAARLDE